MDAQTNQDPIIRNIKVHVNYLFHYTQENIGKVENVDKEVVEARDEPNTIVSLLKPPRRCRNSII